MRGLAHRYPQLICMPRMHPAYTRGRGEMTEAMVCWDSGLGKKTWHMQSSSCNYPRKFFQEWNLETVSHVEGDVFLPVWWAGPPVPYTTMDWLWAQPDKWSVRLASHAPFSSSWRLRGWIKHIPSMPVPHSSVALFSQKSLRQRVLYKLGGLPSILHPSAHAIHSSCTSLGARAWVLSLSCVSHSQTWVLVSKWNRISRCRCNPFSSKGKPESCRSRRDRVRVTR